MLLASVLSLAMLVTGCAEAPPPSTPISTQAAAPVPYACLLPSEQRMLVAELFFGRNIAGRGLLTEEEWANFASRVVTPNFPDGFTVFDGSGQWQNPTTQKIARDPTKILLVAAKRAPDLATRLTTVMEAYKAQFHQQSVGIITRDSCASF